MKFTPREIKENVNISQTSAIREFFVLTSSILGILIAIYLALGFSLDILVDKIPLKTEKKLADFFSRQFYFDKNRSSEEEYIQKLLDDLVANMPEASYKFNVHIVPAKETNAFAFPGGHILVNTALIEEIGSENELSMVLAHELGHYVHRDHLRGLGRGLVLTVFSIFLFGNDSEVTQFLMRVLLTTDLRFSRRQEAFADAFALELLNKKYGHVAGAADFFKHRMDKEKCPRIMKYFSTHPLYADRISMINGEILKKGYKVGEKVPLAPEIKKSESPSG